MKTNDFRQRLRAGDTLLGTIVTLPMAATAEVLTEVGFDWLFLDAEHGSLEYSDILSILQAVGDQVSCIVRLPAAEEASWSPLIITVEIKPPTPISQTNSRRVLPQGK